MPLWLNLALTLILTPIPNLALTPTLTPTLPLTRWGRARVVVVDDGLRVVEHIKQSYTYSAVSACSTLFALVGNDLL